MQIGITGINGLLGRVVSNTIVKNGYTVVSLDDMIRKGFPVDLAQQSDFYPLDWVLHFASKTSIEDSMNDPFTTYEKNINSTLAALKVAEKSGASFLFMSSFVYGIPNYLPIDEKHPVHAINPYMSSKILGEEISTQICKHKQTPLIILRGCNIYGEKIFPGRLISDLFIARKNNECISINNPNPKRDYLYVKDFSDLILKIIEKESVRTGVYNLGYGETHSNLEVANLFCRLIGEERAVKVKGIQRENDVLDCSVNVQLVKQTFSWSPKYTLEEGLKDLLSLKNNV